MKKEHFIRDLKKLKPNRRFESAFLVQQKEVRQTKAGNPFLSMQLADRTGSLDAKMWDNVPAVADLFGAEDFVGVRGKVHDYNSKRQLVIHKLEVIPDDEVFLGDYIPHTNFDVDALYDEILATIDAFSNPHLKRLMRSIFRDEDFAARYRRAPAAKAKHHARAGGLIEHVSFLLKMAKAVGTVYPDIDSDLLVCGALLHDAGKVFELSSDRSFGYTNDGRLLGHIAMGSEWLSKRCDGIDGFPPRLKTLLQHLILSHHGKLEFGSPLLPVFPEAIALHFIDDLDAKLEMMRAARSDTPEGEIWTTFHRDLGRYVLNKAAFLAADGVPSKAHEPSRRPNRKRHRTARRQMRAKRKPTPPRAVPHRATRTEAARGARQTPSLVSATDPSRVTPSPSLPNELPAQRELFGSEVESESRS